MGNQQNQGGYQQSSGHQKDEQERQAAPTRKQDEDRDSKKSGQRGSQSDKDEDSR